MKASTIVAACLSFIAVVVLVTLLLVKACDRHDGRVYQEGATSGAHDLCQELGGQWSATYCQIDLS